MNTTKNIIKEPSHKEEPKPAVEKPPVPAKEIPAPHIEGRAVINPPVEGESTNEKLLRILRNARERLRGRGMPELDVELDEQISEVEGWGDK